MRSMHRQSLQLLFFNTECCNCVFYVPTQIITAIATLERPGRPQQAELTRILCSRIPVTLSWTSVPRFPWRLTVAGKRAGRKPLCTSECGYILDFKKTSCTWTKKETYIKHQDQDWIRASSKSILSVKTSFFVCYCMFLQRVTGDSKGETEIKKWRLFEIQSHTCHAPQLEPPLGVKRVRSLLAA